jgi:hypothetical protein
MENRELGNRDCEFQVNIWRMILTSLGTCTQRIKVEFGYVQ